MKILVWIIMIYTGYCGLLFVMQRKIMYPREIAGTGISCPNYIERMWIQTSSGKIETWFIPPMISKNEPRNENDDSGLDDAKLNKIKSETQNKYPLIIYAHGNAELIDYQVDAFEPLAKIGIAVLLVEFPGYGRSQGSPSQKSITEAFIKAYDMIVSNKPIDTSKIVFMGRSLGTGAICQLAAYRDSKALVLLSPFKSAKSFSSHYFVPSFLILDPFDNLSLVKVYDNPILIIHGKQDEMIPHTHSETLYTNAKHAKLISYNAQHNDCPPSWDEFLQQLTSFLLENKIIDSLQKSRL